MKKIILSMLVAAVVGIGCGSSAEEPNQVNVKEEGTTPAGFCIQHITCLRGQGYCCLTATCEEINGGLGCQPPAVWDRSTCTCR